MSGKVGNFQLLDSFADALKVMLIAEGALAGDGSTGTMPDVTPGEAAGFVLIALHDAGYRFVQPDDGASGIVTSS